MANVIEERTMDVKNIPDLTIGELHVIEMVNKYNNKPMTLIAKNCLLYTSDAADD